jgi:hypothetical protein
MLPEGGMERWGLKRAFARNGPEGMYDINEPLKDLL